MSLKDIRLSKKLTQEELAKRSGIKQNGISRYESGTRTPSMKTAKALAKALGCSIDELISDPEEKQPVSEQEEEEVSVAG